MDFTSFFNFTTIASTVVMDAALLAFLVARFASRGTFNQMWSFLVGRSLAVVGILSIIATLGALVYSNIIGYPACSLCLLQRVFMFPIPFVAIAGVVFGHRRVALVMSLALSVLGALVALYHFAKDMLALYAPELGKIGCPDIAGVPSCDRIYIFELGYITIPTIALTAFIWISIIAYAGLQKK